MHTENTEPLVLSVPQTSTALNCCDATTYSLLKKGVLRRVKVGRKTMVPVEDVLRLVKGSVQA
jgi:excisionase family DNA binding protein